MQRVPKADLIRKAAQLGHYGVTYGTHGLGGWSADELRTAILQSEFPLSRELRAGEDIREGVIVQVSPDGVVGTAAGS